MTLAQLYFGKSACPKFNAFGMFQKYHDQIWHGRRAVAAWAQARAQGPGAQGMPKAQGPVSSTNASVVALIHDDTIIHMAAIPNPIMVFLKHTTLKDCFLKWS